MHHYNRIRETYIRTSGSFGGEARAQRAQRLASITYKDVLRDSLVYGTPEVVAERLGEIRDELGLSGVIMESNVGGRIPQEQVLNSVRLFAQEVAPALR